jgi:hypothetical protein
MMVFEIFPAHAGLFAGFSGIPVGFSDTLPTLVIL